MKIFNHPVFWREKALTVGLGRASIVGLFLQFIPSFSVASAFASTLKDFWEVFGFCWFSCVTFGLASNFRTEDIEAIMATPLGIKDFLKGKALFSTFKFFLYSILITIFIYHDNLYSVAPSNLSFILFLIYPFLIYQWAKFINTIGLLAPDRFMTFIVFILISPVLFICSFSHMILHGQIRQIVELSMLPVIGVLALVANTILFKFIPKDAIRSGCLKD